MCWIRITQYTPLIFNRKSKFRILWSPLNAILYTKSAGARELASQYLLDRGYPARWLFKLILSMNAKFCARISGTKWKVIRKFFYSGLAEKVILPLGPFSKSLRWSTRSDRVFLWSGRWSSNLPGWQQPKFGLRHR